MKKNRSLGVFEEIKRISVSFVILTFIGMISTIPIHGGVLETVPMLS